MGFEIERKFLVKLEELKSLPSGAYIKQGFLVNCDHVCVRVRIKKEKAFITIKGDINKITRVEYEYQIPINDAKYIINNLCSGLIIEKIRYSILYKGHTWEVDIFEGDNMGLILAEIELRYEEENFDRPAWLAEEVTSDSKYYNKSLAVNPYSKWSSNE